MKLSWDHDMALVAFHREVSRLEMPHGIDPEIGLTETIELDAAEAYLSIYQHKEWWTRPAFPKRFQEIPNRSQLVLLKYIDDYIAVLAVTSDVYRADLEGDEKGILVRISSNKEGLFEAHAPAAVVARGSDPYSCIRKAALKAVDLIGHPEHLRKRKKYPEIFESLGWCTWNAFYKDVCENGICEKLDELRDKKIPVKWVLIDDGWSDDDFESQKLQGLDACTDKFPNGLGGAVKRIKKDYGISNVGVWHSIMGYWNGVKADSKAEQLMRDTLFLLPDGREVVAPDRASAFQFYDIWHGYLASKCGIDFVKVDGQSSTSVFYKGIESFGKASEEIQSGLNGSAAAHFDHAVINCMGMAPEEVWKRPGSMINRTSDDFVPDVPHGFREHAIQNSYSMLWAGNFYTGDWDMFYSKHEESVQNGILRAISGGPVYISDKVNGSDAEAVMKLVRQDGTVLRCEGVGLPTRDSLFANPVEGSAVLKIFNHHNEAYYIAAFHISETEQSAECRVSVTDVPELKGREWVLYDERSQSLSLLSEEQSYRTILAANEAVMFEILPAEMFGVIGIQDKYIMDACVETLWSDLHTRLVRVLEAGSLLLYASSSPDCTDETVIGTSRDERIQAVPFGAKANSAEDGLANTGSSRNIYEIKNVYAGEILRISC